METMLFFQLRCGFSGESQQSWLCTSHKDCLEAVHSTMFLFQHVTNMDLVLICFTPTGHIPLFIAIIQAALTQKGITASSSPDPQKQLYGIPHTNMA